jgi:hypothetical protein
MCTPDWRLHAGEQGTGEANGNAIRAPGSVVARVLIGWTVDGSYLFDLAFEAPGSYKVNVARPNRAPNEENQAKSQRSHVSFEPSSSTISETTICAAKIPKWPNPISGAFLAALLRLASTSPRSLARSNRTGPSRS